MIKTIQVKYPDTQKVRGIQKLHKKTVLRTIAKMLLVENIVQKKRIIWTDFIIPIV